MARGAKTSKSSVKMFSEWPEKWVGWVMKGIGDDFFKVE